MASLDRDLSSGPAVFQRHGFGAALGMLFGEDMTTLSLSQLGRYIEPRVSKTGEIFWMPAGSVPT